MGQLPPGGRGATLGSGWEAPVSEWQSQGQPSPCLFVLPAQMQKEVPLGVTEEWESNFKVPPDLLLSSQLNGNSVLYSDT